MMTFDPGGLRAALAGVPPGSWSNPSSYVDTGVHHGYRRIVLVDHGRRLPAADQFASVLDVFAPVRAAFLSWLDPGGFIAPHRDRGPYYERWQVPIQASGWFDDERPVDGVAFPVEHWKPHAVWNDGDQPRIHIVIDRDIPAGHPPEPFTAFPVPAEFAHLVDRASQTRKVI